MTMSVAPSMDGAAWLALCTLAVLWGSSFVFAEVLLTALPVLTIVALRVALAAVTLWSLALVVGAAPPRSVRPWRAFALLGLFNNVVPFCLIVSGQTMITAGLAAVLNATTPIFAALFAAAVADERLTGRKAVGLALGFAGVAVAIGPKAIGSGTQSVWGPLMVLGAAASYGASAVFARRFRGMGLSPLAVATGQTTMSSAVLVPLALAVDRPFDLPAPPPGIWLTVAANAVLSTALAYVLYFTVLARAGATNASLVTVLVPVVAIVIGVVALGEPVTLGQLAGMGLVASGLLTLDGRLWRAG